MIPSIYLLVYTYSLIPQNDAFTSIGDIQKGSSHIHIISIVSSAGLVRRTRMNGELAAFSLPQNNEHVHHSRMELLPDPHQ